jgi:hypothetical protein
MAVTLADVVFGEPISGVPPGLLRELVTGPGDVIRHAGVLGAGPEVAG